MLIYFILLSVLHLSVCYDVELDAVIRLNKKFIDQLDGYNAVPHNRPGDQRSHKDPILKFFNFIKPSAYRDTRKIFNVDQFVVNYKKNLTEKGIRSLESLERQLDLNNEEHKVVEPIMTEYKTEMKNQFEKIDRIKTEYNYEWKIVLFDIIETSNKILYSFKKKLINTIVYENDTDSSNIQSVVKEVFKDSVYDKRDEFNYVCEKIKVCHTYPGFSDYIADLISEVLKLNNMKVTLVMSSLKKFIISQIDFFKTVIPDEIITLISFKINPAAEAEMRELLSILRAVITQRYKLVPSNDEGVKLRTTAIRVLLDIIDKAFDVEDETLTSIHFDSTVKGLRQFGGGYRTDINPTVIAFVNNIVGVLKHNLDKSIKEELKALSEIIVTGTSKDMDRFRYLFTRGSNFVPDE